MTDLVPVAEGTPTVSPLEFWEHGNPLARVLEARQLIVVTLTLLFVAVALAMLTVFFGGFFFLLSYVVLIAAVAVAVIGLDAFLAAAETQSIALDAVVRSLEARKP